MLIGCDSSQAKLNVSQLNEADAFFAANKFIGGDGPDKLDTDYYSQAANPFTLLFNSDVIKGFVRKTTVFTQSFSLLLAL